VARGTVRYVDFVGGRFLQVTPTFVANEERGLAGQRGGRWRQVHEDAVTLVTAIPTVVEMVI